MSSGRRGFLQTLAAFAASGSTVSARLLRAQSQTRPADETWDVAWKDRLSGKFRAVFDCPEVNGGIELWRAATWKAQVIDVHSVPESEINAVVVIRHAGIPMIMNDEFWARHKLGEKRSIKDPRTQKPAERNPFLSATDATASSSGAGSSTAGASTVDSFIQRGGIVLACNFAFGRMVALLRASEKELSRDEARARALSQVIPGVILQPSGFFAAIEAQRSGCAFFPSTMGAD